MPEPAMPLFAAEALVREEREVSRHFKRNFVAHSLEGGLFMGGVAFLHPQTVAPRMIERLGGPDWMIAAAPILQLVGFYIPSLFLTHRLERLAFLKPFVMYLGVLQRLPYLLMGIALLFARETDRWVLPLVMLTPLLSGLAGGVSITAWREYVAKSIPAPRRASLWACRFVLGGVLGVAAGQGVQLVLGTAFASHGSAGHGSALPAYGVLHFGVLGGMLASYGVLAVTREPNLPSTRAGAEKSWWGYARSMRRIVENDARMAPYLLGRALFSGLYVVLPFLGLRALEVLHCGDGYLGRLLMCQMLGSVAGNLTAGVVGDRSGGRAVMLLSQASSVVVAAAAPALHSPLGFELLFLALGWAIGLGNVGVATLDLEMSGFAQRMSYQTLIGLSHLLGMVGAVTIAALIRQVTLNFSVLACIAGALNLGCFALLVRLAEPRRAALLLAETQRSVSD
jgi:MFS family permease